MLPKLRAGPEQIAIANRLLWYASQPQFSKEAATYRAIAQAILEARDPIPIDPAIAAQYAQQSSASQAAQVLPTQPTQAQPATAAPATGAQVINAAVPKKQASTNPFELLENINVLLFVGAFLVVVSVIVFVGANYDAVSNLSKMLLTTFFAILSYASGLFLYQKPKLRPAGITFTAIGMVMVPILGIAYRNFIAPDSDSMVVWFVVSLLSMIAYVGTAQIIKHWALQYAVILALLSSIDSGLLALNAPSYIIAWVSVLSAGVMAVFSKSENSDMTEYKSDPYGLTSYILVPISLLVSLFHVFDHGFWQLGVSAVLAGLFYVELALLRTKLSHSKDAFTAGLLLVPFGSVILLFEAGASREVSAAVVMGVICLYVLFQAAPFNKWMQLRVDSVEQATVAGMIATLIVWPQNQTWWLSLFAVGAIAAMTYVLVKRLSYAWLAMAALVVLPTVIPFSAIQEAEDTQRLISVAAYVLVGVCLMMARYSRPFLSIKKITKVSLEYIVIAGILAVHVAGTLVAAGGSASLFVFALLWSGLVAAAMSYLERERAFQVAAHALWVASLFWMPDALMIDTASYYMLYGYGLVVYLGGVALSSVDLKSGLIARFAGLVALSLSTISLNSWFTVMGLFTIGALLLVESKLQRMRAVFYLAITVLTVATHWTLMLLEIKEVIVFSWLWTLYFASIAYLEKRQNNNSVYELFTVLALFSFTIPLAVQTLDSGELERALLLSVQAIVLIMFGMYVRVKVIWQWGLVVLVLEVLYQMRDVIGAVPKQLVSLMVGLGIIAFAIYFLNKRSDD